MVIESGSNSISRKILLPGPGIAVIECSYGYGRDNRIDPGYKQSDHQPVAGHDPDLRILAWIFYPYSPTDAFKSCIRKSIY